jgi:manganese-transporting P-type ATPase
MAPLKTAPFPGGQVDVASPDVAGLTLVTPLPLYARVYIGPWLIAYPLAAYAFYGNYDKYIKSIGEQPFFCTSKNPEADRRHTHSLRFSYV